MITTSSAERELGAAALAGDRREGHGQRRVEAVGREGFGAGCFALRAGRVGGVVVVVVVVVEVAATSASSVATKLPGVRERSACRAAGDPVVVDLGELAGRSSRVVCSTVGFQPSTPPGTPL